MLEHTDRDDSVECLMKLPVVTQLEPNPASDAGCFGTF
jgi:hypothetical protein